MRNAVKSKIKRQIDFVYNESVLEICCFCKNSHNDVIFWLKMDIPRKYAYLCRKFIN